MTFVFTTWHFYLSYLISVFTWSLWSHVEAELTGEYLFGANYRAGVGYVYKDRRVARSSKALSITIPMTPEQEAKFRKFMYDQHGKPYDIRGAIGFWFGRRWNEQDKWYCSELMAAGLVTCDYPGAKEEFGDARRVSPGKLKKFLMKVPDATSVYLKS